MSSPKAKPHQKRRPAGRREIEELSSRIAAVSAEIDRLAKAALKLARRRRSTGA